MGVVKRGSGGSDVGLEEGESGGEQYEPVESGESQVGKANG